MKAYTLVLLLGANLAASGCAITGNQLGNSATPNQSSQSSRADTDYENSSKDANTGSTVRDTVNKAQDITQTAREATSTAYEVRRTINDLKNLMEGW